MVGGNAGSHLICSLMTLCVMRGVRLPDELYLFYPSLTFDQDVFTPSLLLCLDDLMLKQPEVKFYGAAYNRKNANPKNPLLSPYYTPDYILAKYPKTVILACEIDPLRDVSYILAMRLKKLGVETKFVLFKDYIHGYLGFLTKFGIPEYFNGSKKILEMMANSLDVNLASQKNKKK